MKEHKHYVEVVLPIDPKDESILNFRNEIDKKVPYVDWIDPEEMPYHVTLAFLHELGDSFKVADALKSFSIGYSASLDSIKVFSDKRGKRHVIAFSSSDIPDRFMKSVDELRKRLAEAGAAVEPDFMFHVTLGFVDAGRISLDELQKRVAEVPAPGFYLSFSVHRLTRTGDHKALWDSTRDMTDDCKFDYNSIRQICNFNHKRILAHHDLSYIMDYRKIRFINPMGEFDYTTFGNFIMDAFGVMLLITKDAKYTCYHHWGLLDYSLWSVVPVIFAGVSTGYTDDTGREIFAGDIVTMDDHFTSMVKYLKDYKEPFLVGDNCEVFLSKAHKSLHIEGTAYCNMSAKMFEEYDNNHINWYYSQFQPCGLSRDEVIRMAKLACYHPHFINELNIIDRNPAAYSNVYDVMKGNYKVAYIVSASPYDDADGNIYHDIYADNLPMDVDFESYEINMVKADTVEKQLEQPFRDFIDYAHCHPDTVFILCDFKEFDFITSCNKKNLIRPLLPITKYNIRNIILPAWMYFDLDAME